MARSDLLLNLVKAGVSGDVGTFRRTVEAIVAEERAKQHNVVADQIERAVASKPVNGSQSVPRAVGEGSYRARDFLSEVIPRRRLDDVVLSQSVGLAVRQLIEEQQRASLLRSHSIEPRHRVLLIGPPGNGKTTLAEAIAESLALPFLVIRYEAIIGSFLGETAGRLKRVFDYVRTIPCVLFFDEFDAIGKERGDTHETGEIKRVVTSLLMQIDELPSYVVVVAATNHPELLDRAVWRRFQQRLTLPAPSSKQIAEFLDQLTRNSQFSLDVPTKRIAQELGPLSFSEAEEFFMDVWRRKILSMDAQKPAEIAREQLKLWKGRAQSSKRGGRKHGAAPNS